jgi:aminopeptidase N
MFIKSQQLHYDELTGGAFGKCREGDRLIKRAGLAVWPVLLVLCFVSPAFSRDNYPRRTSLDAVHYRIRLDLPERGEEFSAEAEILFAVNAEGLREIPLDFEGLLVEGVKVDGVAAQYKLAGGRLGVTLPGSHQRGERIVVTVKYHGHPSDGLFFKQNKFGDRTVFADNWPNRAHYWFPSIDHPYDKATVEFFVRAPASFDVVANGALLEETSRQDGTKLTHWSEGVPIPVYNMVVGATEFSVLSAGAFDGTPLFFYLFPRDRDRGIKDFGRARQMLEFYAGLVGPYPYEKLALVQSSTRFGGMENSSNIFFDEKSIKGEGLLEGTVAHEIAHQWFGDSVTQSDWHHLWLSEGFASYFGNLFFERADGRDKFVVRMLASKERYLKEAAESGARPIYDTSITDLFKLLNRNNYDKGSWVLHMLRRELGDEKFFAGIRDYYCTFRDRNALTEDFQRVMEFHAGHPLGWFFRQWIYEPGHPVLEAAWRWDEGAKQLRLRVRQTQAGTHFRAPLDLEIKSGNETRREVLQLDEREETFSLKLDAKPQGLRLDPDEWILKTLTLRAE